MKKITYVILMGLLFSMFSCQKGNEYFEIMSFNVRLNHPGDGDNQWVNRTPIVSAYLAERQPALVGMQEVLPGQLEDLSQMLVEYRYIRAGRMDGEARGEACPIFYRPDLFELMESGHFWLSETPDVPGSMSWDTQFPRIVTWTKLESTITGHPLFVFNTHFSHISEKARSQSARLLIRKIHEIAGDGPVILTGDFNTTRGTDTYQQLISGDEDAVELQDAETLAGFTVGGNVSFNAFNPEYEGKRIDFIFVNDYFDVKMHYVDEVRDAELFISDHYPVAAKVRIR